MLEPTKKTIINSRKFNGEIHRTWNAELIEKIDSLLVFVGTFENEIRHPKLGVIRRGTISYEYYWLDRWYNIFKFHEPEGDLRNFYCNINIPPKFENHVLDYIDLDLDVLVSKNFEVEVLDRDEFEENAKLFKYSPELKTKTLTTLEELLSFIEMRAFPFS